MKIKQMLRAFALCIALPMSASAENWPQWRGPAGDGVSPETGLPTNWSDDKNIAWKTDLPGEGVSTPAIWENALFVTAQDGRKLLLSKLNKADGIIVWTQQVGESEMATGSHRRRGSRRRDGQTFHELHNMASPSPVTDGKVVVTHFGNGDLAAYDFDGNQLWKRNLQEEHGNYTIWWGHANSPIIYKDLVISVCMQDCKARGDKLVESYLVAHDKTTGEQKWKNLRMTGARSEPCDSYTTPLLYEGKNGPEIIIMGANHLDGYDPMTGQRIWFLPGLQGGRTITGPTLAGDSVVATQGMRGPLLAVKLGSTGELDDSAISWKHRGGTADSCTPVASNGLVFWVSDRGVATCVDATTGEQKWQERINGDYKASPIVGGGNVYFLDRNGKCTVVAAKPTFEKVAVNRIEAQTVASPAVSDGRLYLRGNQTLYCIETQ